MAVVENNAVSSAGTTRILPADAVFHEAADIFPAMSDAEFRELVEDIREYGQREPVWILADGRVIDGKHRVKACAELGRSVDARVYHGEGDAIVDFVLSLNMVRRHLSINQKLAAAHKAMPMYREQAKQGRLATLKQGEEMPVSANWREREEGKAAHHVANLFGVSPRAVERAEAVYRDGAPGVGKTHLGRCLLNKAVGSYRDIAEGSAYTIVQAAARYGSEAKIKAWQTADVLLLDDIDKGAYNEAGLAALWQLLDARSKPLYRTIVTSNLSTKALLEYLIKCLPHNTSYAMAAMDRLMPLTVYNLVGTSLR